MSMYFEKIANAVIEGEDEDVVSLVNGALAAGVSPEEVLNQGLIAGMDIVAIKFRDEEMFIPEVLMAANAMQEGNNLLRPLLAAGKIGEKGKVVVGTVAGDLHDIGKRIVGMMLEGAGFEIIDLGMDVPVSKFVEAVKTHSPVIVGMSAMLTTTMPVMREVVETLTEEGLIKNISVMVGGAPVNDDFAKKIGAEYSYDAASAVDLAKKLAGF